MWPLVGQRWGEKLLKTAGGKFELGAWERKRRHWAGPHGKGSAGLAVAADRRSGVVSGRAFGDDMNI